MDKTKLIDKLNEAIALELCGVLQYNQFAQVLLGADRKIWQDFFIGSSDESLSHARLFAERVVALGGQPTCEPATFRQTNDIKEMLTIGLAHEQRAVQAYTEALAFCDDSPAYRNLLEDQIDAEHRDVEEMAMYLGQVDKAASSGGSQAQTA